MKYALKFFTLLVVVATLSSAQGQETCQSLNDSVTLYMNTSQFFHVGELSERAIAVCEMEVGKMHQDYADALVNKSVFLMHSQSDFKNALSLLFDADSIYIKNGITGTKAYGTLLGNIGGAYTHLGNYTEAEKFFREALRISIAASDSANLGNRYNGLGIALFGQAKYEESFQNMEIALALLEVQKSKFSPYYLAAVFSYGQLLSKAGRNERQYTLMKEVLPIVDTVFMGQPQRGVFWRVWGESNLMTGRYAQALQILETVKIIQLKTLINDNQPVEYGRVLNSLALTLRRLGRYRSALTMQEEAIRILENNFGPIHPETLTGVGNLTVLYTEMGEMEKAYTLFERTLKEMKAQFRGRHFELLNLQSNYSSFLYELGFPQKALMEIREYEKNYPTEFGDQTVLYARYLGNKGVVYAELGQLDSAIEYHTRALRVLENNRANNTYEYAVVLQGLSSDYKQTGKIDSAIALAKQALAIMLENEMGNTPMTSKILMHLAELNSKRGQYTPALDYAFEALSVVQNSTGVSSKDYPTIIGRIGRVQELAGQVSEAFASYQKSVLLAQEHIAKTSGIYSYGGEEAFAQQMLPVLKTLRGLFIDMLNIIKRLPVYYLIMPLPLDFLLLQQSRSAIQAARSSPDTAVVARVNTWNDLKQLWAFQSNLPPEKRQFNLDTLASDIERLERSLTASFLPLKQSREKVSWQNVQTVLASDEAAVQFISFPADEGTGPGIVYYALVLRPGYTHPRMVYLFQERQLSLILNQKPHLCPRRYYTRRKVVCEKPL